MGLFFSFNGIGAQATYDWINPFGKDIPWSFKGDWNWYLGVGAGGGAYNLFWQTIYNPYIHWFAGAVGHVGVEYQFWFPLQLSVDFRPNIGACGYSDGYNNYAGYYVDGLFNVTLGVRYLF